MGGGPTESTDAEQLELELENCVEVWLRPYLKRLGGNELQPKPKVINDALWGSIRLHAWEVAILDTPLLQRLRHLRQLGVVHWVYPSAGHSRLEHSLGVLHQMEALLSALERSCAAGSDSLDDATRKLLRVAALVHDCGHAIMSHVSEEFIDDLPGVHALRTKLHREFKPRKRPSASEAFAAVFVQSPAFRELLAQPNTGAAFIRNVKRATQRIAALILGGPAIAESAFLTLLVNGAFDADKLDYMPRDSLMAGVPCPVDVRRVIETVRVLEVPRSAVPTSYPRWAGLDPTVNTIRVLTLTGSGARVLDELAMSKSLLYEKVYFHHKVRALEVMVRRALRSMGTRSVTEWLQLVDDELLFGDKTRAIFLPVMQRDLLKRAVIVSAPEGSDTPEETTDAEASWAKLMAPGSHERLRATLIEEAAQVAKLLDSGQSALDRQPPEVDAPPMQRIGLDQHAFIGDSIEEFKRASATRSGQRPEAGRLAARQVVYVFAPEGAVLPVFVAARKVLRRDYGIDIGADAYRATRLDPHVIADAERTLTESGYFGDDVPVPIPEARLVSHEKQALETFLRTSWARLEGLATTFGQYQPLDGGPISPGRIAEFLRQFGTDRLARSALLVLEAIEFKDRRAISAALGNLLSTVAIDAVVCPLGAAGDSSAFLSYLMNDLPADKRRPLLPLELALDDEEPAPSTIVLWDDFCGTGGHAATVISQWLGLPRIAGDDQVLLDEQHVHRLNKARAAALCSKDVRVAFALARPTGIANLRSFLKRHEIDYVQVCDTHETVIETNRVFDTRDIIPNDSDRTALREFLEQRMRVALEPNTLRSERAWSEAKLAQRLLGYGQEAHLIVFPYNVPTVTLTALWTEGPGWRPLFRRRGKPTT